SLPVAARRLLTSGTKNSLVTLTGVTTGGGAPTTMSLTVSAETGPPKATKTHATDVTVADRVIHFMDAPPSNRASPDAVSTLYVVSRRKLYHATGNYKWPLRAIIVAIERQCHARVSWARPGRRRSASRRAPTARLRTPPPPAQ